MAGLSNETRHEVSQKKERKVILEEDEDCRTESIRIPERLM